MNGRVPGPSRFVRAPLAALAATALLALATSGCAASVDPPPAADAADAAPDAPAEASVDARPDALSDVAADACVPRTSSWRPCQVHQQWGYNCWPPGVRPNAPVDAETCARICPPVEGPGALRCTATTGHGAFFLDCTRCP